MQVRLSKELAAINAATDPFEVEQAVAHLGKEDRAFLDALVVNRIKAVADRPTHHIKRQKSYLQTINQALRSGKE